MTASRGLINEVSGMVQKNVILTILLLLVVNHLLGQPCPKSRRCYHQQKKQLNVFKNTGINTDQERLNNCHSET